MKPFVVKDILEDSKRAMSRIGIWPEPNPTFGYRLKTLASPIFGLIGALFCVLQAFNEFRMQNFDKACFTMCYSLGALRASFVVWILQKSIPKFMKIVECLEDPAVASHEDRFDEHLQSKLQLCDRVRKVFLYGFMFTAFLGCANELLEDYTHTASFFFIQKSIYDDFAGYISLMIFTNICVPMNFYIIGSFEGFVFTLINIGIAQLNILNAQITYSLQQVTSADLNPKEHAERDAQVNKLLKEYVIRHNAIGRYVAAVEDKFSLGFLFQVVVSLVVMGLIEFSVIFVDTRGVDFYKSICTGICAFGQLMIVCIGCDEIIYKSEYIRDACYMSNWYYCGPSVRKTLFIIMERSKRSFRLTASGFTVISLQTMVGIVKTSVSFYTLIKRMYEK